jgi:hypothetical protein
MRRKLYTRLIALERTCETVRLAQRSAALANGSFTEQLRRTLHTWGIEQGETESLADAFARALGITTRELKTRLQEMACGPSPNGELMR